MTACQTASELKVTSQSVDPGSEITWLGEKTRLEGQGRLRVGDRLPTAELVDIKMVASTIKADGKVLVIDTIPSIDTPVCDRQTHILGETAALRPGIERITISADLPYAFRRFAEETKIANVEFYSDYRHAAFGRSTGLQIARNGLLTRSVMVVDQKGVIRHLQVVPEITDLPDMDQAFKVANSLVDGH